MKRSRGCVECPIVKTMLCMICSHRPFGYNRRSQFIAIAIRVRLGKTHAKVALLFKWITAILLGEKGALRDQISDFEVIPDAVMPESALTTL
jgi:hypothetical protein